MRLKTCHFKTTIQIVTINGTTLVEDTIQEIIYRAKL